MPPTTSTPHPAPAPDDRGRATAPSSWKRFVPDAVRETDVVRVGADILGNDLSAAAHAARSEVVDWMHARCGLPLGPGAHAHADMVIEGEGARAAAIRTTTTTTDTWAARLVQDNVAVEVVVRERIGWAPTFTTRVASTSDDVEPRTPDIFRRVANRVRLRVEELDVAVHPWTIASEADAVMLCDLLEEAVRSRPVFVLSVAPGASTPSVDPGALLAAVCGNAVVAVLPHRFTWSLSARFGMTGGVHSGAVRTYMPGFDASDDGRDHPYLKLERLRTEADRNRWISECAAVSATEGLRRLRMGTDVRSFASIEAIVLREQASHVRSPLSLALPGQVPDTAALDAFAGRVAELEAEVASLRKASIEAGEEVAMALALASAAESSTNKATCEVARLNAMLRARGAEHWEIAAPPANWAGMADWVDANLAGKVSLAPLARRKAKDAPFEDVALIHRCLLWLAGRTSAELASGNFNDVMLESGVKNSRCGSEAFAFDTGAGTRQSADWHIKTNARTYDPRRCLRIYYAWDAAQRMVVIADWPTHRPCDF